MSTREVIGRLDDAKRKLQVIKGLGDQCANTITEAANSVNRALDDMQDKGLGSALSAKAKEISDEFDGVMGLSRGIDLAIARIRNIGRR